MVEQLGQGIHLSQDLYLHKIHPDNSHRHTSMPQEKFQPKIPVFELEKEVHDLQPIATATFNNESTPYNQYLSKLPSYSLFLLLKFKNVGLCTVIIITELIMK